MSALDDLPLFATDEQLAEAIVGKKAAKDWMQKRLPTLAGKPGFPPIDEFHGGRPVSLVKRFYNNYLGEASADRAGRPDGAENESAWTRSKRRA